MDNHSWSQGGAFLLGLPPIDSVSTPDDFSREIRAIGELAEQFASQEVKPLSEAMEHGEHEHNVHLLRKAGELGLLAGDIPEQYGGLGLPPAATTLIAEKLGATGAFSVTYGAHAGIGTLPIVFFGNTEQKKKYLPDLASGKKVSAYALTEPGAGSDALSGTTRADRSDDGRVFLLNGEKQWISNAGFADIFIVYAKMDGDKFTAFIVEREFGGVSTSSEFKKMGLKGSSTRTVRFDNTPVPAENVLGEIGRGHVIAFNTLNLGRWKLAAGCIGACKQLIEEAVGFALQRRQFGRPIAEFPLIQQKLAHMSALTYALESMVYRTAGLFENRLRGVHDRGEDAPRLAAASISEFAVEASINKVFGSEALDAVVDEAVQIHGGYGYMQDYPVERAYRDARINRIFEGTNEINRLLIPGTLFRRASKGQLPLMAAVQQVQSELMEFSPTTWVNPQPGCAALAHLHARLEGARRAGLLIAGLAVMKHGEAIEHEQELLAAVADLAIEIFAVGSALLRAEKANARGLQDAGLHADLTRLFAAQAFDKIETTARRALATLAQGDELQAQLSVLRRLLGGVPDNTTEIGRRIAGFVLQRESYPLPTA